MDLDVSDNVLNNDLDALLSWTCPQCGHTNKREHLLENRVCDHCGFDFESYNETRLPPDSNIGYE